MSYYSETPFPAIVVPKVVQSVTSVAAPGINSAGAGDYLSITLPSAGRWRLSYSVRAYNSVANTGVAAFLTNAANVEYVGSKIIVIYSAQAVNLQLTSAGSHIVTTTSANEVVKMRIHSANIDGGVALSDAANGYSWIMAESI